VTVRRPTGALGRSIAFSAAAVLVVLVTTGRPIWSVSVLVAAVALVRLGKLGLARGVDEATVRAVCCIVLFMLGFVSLFRAELVSDALLSYGYTASVTLDGDLHLYDELVLHAGHFLFDQAAVRSIWSCGTAVLQAPFFLIGHLVVVALRSAGVFQVTTGFADPCRWAVGLASAWAVLLGCLVVQRWLRSTFSAGPVLLATAALWFGGPLLVFTYRWTGWHHPFALLVTAIFIAAWHATRGRRTMTGWAVLGGLVGLLVLIRPSSIAVGLLAVVEWMLDLRWGRATAAGPAAAIVGAALVLSPQASLSKVLTGQWSALPWGIDGCISAGAVAPLPVSSSGVSCWTLLVVMGLVGLVVGWRQCPLTAGAGLLVVLATAGLTDRSTVGWADTLCLLPVVAWGMTALLERARRVVDLERLCMVLAVVVAHNVVRTCDGPSLYLDAWRHQTASVIVPALVLSIVAAIGAMACRRLVDVGGALGSTVVVLTVVVVVVVHVAVWRCADGGRMGDVVRLNVDDVVVSVVEPEATVFCGDDGPMTAIDVLSHVVSGAALRQDIPVAVVTVVARDGRRFVELLLAGRHTAEVSALLAETARGMRHTVASTEVVRRQSPGDGLVYRAVVTLPDPVLVDRVEVRYVAPVGSLVVTDLYARNGGDGDGR